jgi:hypothetical protein
MIYNKYIMAEYPIPTNSTNTFNNSSFNNSDNNGGLTVEEGLKYFVAFPNTQTPSTIVADNLETTGNLDIGGDSQFGGDVNFVGGATIDGILTFNNNVTMGQNLIMDGVYNTNYLEFPDGTKQYTAVAGSDILNTNNTFAGVNTFFPPTQTFGSTLNQGLTFTNNQYINGSGDTDIIAYIPDSTTGLCIFALTTNSASFNTPQIQLLPDGTASNFQASAINGIVSIISNNTGGTIQLKSDSGVQLVHNASLKFSTYGTLTGGSTGLSSSANFIINPSPVFTNGATVTQGITLTNNQVDAGGGGDNDIVSYTPNTTKGLCIYSLGIYDNCSGKSPQIQLFPDGVETLIQAQSSNGKVILSAIGTGGTIELNASSGVTIGQNGKLNFNLYGNLTGSSSGITSSISLILPAQTTYDSGATYGNIASTQEFVQKALASQGSGDVTLAGNNLFTGLNAYNTSVPTSTVSQAYPSISTTNFATIGYVNSIASQVYTSTISGVYNISYYSTNYIYHNSIGNTIFYNGLVTALVPLGQSFNFTFYPALTTTALAATPINNITLFNTGTGGSYGMTATITNNTVNITYTYDYIAGSSFTLTFSGSITY